MFVGREASLREPGTRETGPGFLMDSYIGILRETGVLVMPTCLPSPHHECIGGRAGMTSTEYSLLKTVVCIVRVAK